jgi:hypothetical protein
LLNFEPYRFNGSYGSIEMLVFEKIRSDAHVVVQSVVAEGHLWCLAGAKALQELAGRIGSYRS